MHNTFKKTLTAAIFAMFVALPLSAQAVDNGDTTTANMPVSVQETLNTITSIPKGIDGELIRTTAASPVNTHHTTVAQCIFICIGGDCDWVCW